MFDLVVLEAAEHLLEVCKRKGLTVATAESCTGGLVAGAISAISGSSDGARPRLRHLFQRRQGADARRKPTTLDAHGAVSRECAEEMAKGALEHAGVDLTVSITGIAGPTGATPGKPVGLVHFAAAARGGRLIAYEGQYGDVGRSQVRRLSLLQALAMLNELAEAE